jgi:hypothetical protein
MKKNPAGPASVKYRPSAGALGVSQMTRTAIMITKINPFQYADRIF